MSADTEPKQRESDNGHSVLKFARITHSLLARCVYENLTKCGFCGALEWETTRELKMGVMPRQLTFVVRLPGPIFCHSQELTASSLSVVAASLDWVDLAPLSIQHKPPVSILPLYSPTLS